MLRNSFSRQDNCLADKSGTESKSGDVDLPNIANKSEQEVPRNTKNIANKSGQEVPRNTKKIVSNVPPVKARKQPQVKGPKTMNGRANSPKEKNSPTIVGSNSRLLPRSSSLKEPKPSVVARNQSFQSNLKPRRAHSISLDLHRSNPSLSKLTSSEAGSTIPTGWRCYPIAEKTILSNFSK